jgi:phospholipase/carboxylesterase
MTTFDGIERETGDEISLAIIWLHGLGADASDFLPLIGALQLPAATRFVFPNAPVRAVTINGGMRMRAWYDIIGFAPDAADDTVGLGESAAAVRALVEREVARGIARERIFLVGFSQGGAVVQHAGLAASEPLGGIVGLSTYLPAVRLLQSSGAIQTETPVWLAHGTHDPVIPLALGERSVQLLRTSGVTVGWTVYPMRHEVCPPEVGDLNAWLATHAFR